MKALKIIAIGGAVFLGGRYLFSLKRTGNKAVVQVGGKVDKVTISGVVVELKFNIKNPTRSNIEMAIPLIKLSHDGKILASSSMALVEIPVESQSDNGRIRILPYKETGTITTSILLPFLSLIGTGANLVTRLKNKLDPAAQQVTIKFEIETNSTIYTSLGDYPYDDKSIIDV